MERWLTGFVWTVVIAETSLYIPGFDEQPVSVDVVGAGPDPDDRTTLQIVPSKQTGAILSSPFSITGKFILSQPSSIPTENDHPHVGGGVCDLQKNHRINVDPRSLNLSEVEVV